MPHSATDPPEPGRKRARGPALTTDECRDYLCWLASTGCPTKAAEFAGRDPGSFRTRKSRSAKFRRQCELAMAEFLDKAEYRFWVELKECGSPRVACGMAGLSPTWYQEQLAGTPGFRERVEMVVAQCGGPLLKRQIQAAEAGNLAAGRWVLSTLFRDELHGGPGGAQ